ncbi:MAG: aspartate-semialdehyde dehydrogenase [Planctomycetes bacterium]|nr:aspartate-semialdehyde dehydrogenase [Planctomycetota bacterium]
MDHPVRPRTVAVIGATGAVGREAMERLHRRRFPVGELRAIASQRSAGGTLPFAGGQVTVQALDEASIRGVEVAILAADAATSREWAPRLVHAGAVVVDNSSAFRMDPQVPLVVPEINGGELAGRPSLVANPNCTTIISLMAAAPLHHAFGLRRITACSYQAVSGAGLPAMQELEGQARQWSAGEPVQSTVFRRPTLFNVFPHDSALLPDGSNEEETKLVKESRRILDLPDLRVSVTCVRVPVRRAHAVALHLEFERRVDPEVAREVLSRAEGVRLVDERSGSPADPLMAAEGDEVLVSRIRRDFGAPEDHGLALWTVGDQLLKGAALNAIQIAERLLGDGASGTRRR